MTVRDAIQGFITGLRKSPMVPVANQAPTFNPQVQGLNPAPAGQGQSIEVVDTTKPPTQANVPGSWSRYWMPPGKPYSMEAGLSGGERETEPRSFQYISSVNSTISPRIAYGLMAFADLKAYALNVPECSLCIRLPTEELKAFIPKIVDDNDNEIHIQELEWMVESPDGFNPYPVWLSRFLFNVLAYDAPAVYKVRRQTGNELTKRRKAYTELISSTGELKWVCRKCGQVNLFSYPEDGWSGEETVACGYCQTPGHRELHKEIAHDNDLRKEYSGEKIVGLRIIDGSTIFAVIDERGEQPAPPAPAFTQVIWGTTRLFLNTHQLWYRPRFLRPDAPYGRTFIEDALPAVKLLASLWDYELDKYQLGNIPEMAVTAPEKWTDADKILDWEEAYNARMAGNTKERAGRLRMFPAGVQQLAIKEMEFNKETYDAASNAVRIAAGIPKSEVGEAPEGMLGGKGFAEAMQSSFYRMLISPLQSFVESLFNDIINENGYSGVKWKMTFPSESLDPEKEETKNATRFQIGGITRNEYRDAINMPKLEGEEGEFIVSPGGGAQGEEGDGGMGALAGLFGGGGAKKPATPGISTNAKPPMKNPVDVLDKPVAVTNKKIPVAKLATEDDKLEKALMKYAGVEANDDEYYGTDVKREVDVPMPKQGANDSFVVGIGDVLHETRPAVWKPVDGEDEKIKKWVGGDLYRRAEAVYLIDRELAEDSNHYLVPVTWATELDGVPGSVQHYVKGREQKQDVFMYDKAFTEQAAVLDYITGQMDRDKKNWVTHPDNHRRPVLIDNDCSFGVLGKIHSTFVEAMRGRELSPGTIDSVYLVLGDQDLWQDVSTCLGNEILVQQARERAQKIYEERCIPLVDFVEQPVEGTDGEVDTSQEKPAE